MQPFAASKRLVAALEKNGVDYRYFVAKHSGHGLQNDNKVYMEYLDAVVEYLDKYMKDGPCVKDNRSGGCHAKERSSGNGNYRDCRYHFGGNMRQAAIG